MELISIIIPVYNAEKYLQKCIESIINQTYNCIEIIIVDDGSTDCSMKMVEKYIKKDYRIILLKQNNKGPNAARKLGLSKAKGKYIMFVDADDHISPYMCEKMVMKIQAEKVDIVGCGICDSRGKMFIPFESGRKKGRQVAASLIKVDEFYAANYVTSLWGYLYKYELVREIFDDIDLRIDFSEDVICLLLMLWCSNEVFYMDDCLYYVTKNNNSLTHNHLKRHYESQKYLYQYAYKKFQKLNVSMILYEELERLVIRDLLLSGYKEAFGHLQYLFPYDGVKIGSKIIVYGAGAMGIEIVSYIIQSQKYILTQWIDQNADLIQSELFKVQKPYDIEIEKCDYIVIAVTDNRIAKKIYLDLLKRRIPSSKIRLINESNVSYNVLPLSFEEKKR